MLNLQSFAQVENAKAKKDSTAKTVVDSSIIKHSPRKATLMSVACPGLGQVYNKKYWKVPVIYTGFAILGYFIYTNNQSYLLYRNQFRTLSGDTSIPAYQALIVQLKSQYVNLNISDYATSAQSARDYYRHNRDLSWMLTGLLYVINIADADVDAHLFFFDVSDKLSMNWKPTFYQDSNLKNYAGLSFKLNF
jgi:hypothetical protein